MAYIGRPGRWGNPFVIGKDGSRKDVVDKFEHWFHTSDDSRAVWMRENIHLLQGEELWCPGCKGTSPCHGDVLREYLRHFKTSVYGD